MLRLQTSQRKEKGYQDPQGGQNQTPDQHQRLGNMHHRAHPTVALPSQLALADDRKSNHRLVNEWYAQEYSDRRQEARHG